MSVNLFLCILCMTGVCIVEMDLLQYYLRLIFSRMRIIRNLKQYTDFDEFAAYGKIGKKINLLLEGTDTKKYFRNANSFIGFSCLLGIGLFLIVLLAEDFLFALICGSFAMCLPAALLTSKLRNMRIERSKEGNQLVSELLIYYRICDCNILEAVKNTAQNIEDAPVTKVLLYNLAKGLQNSVTRDEVIRYLKIFRYSIGTTWCNILATNIFFAHMYGIRIDSALSDLAASIVKGQKILAHSQRENNEARLILKFLTPVTYFLSVAGACLFFGFTPQKYIRYQFFTSLGLRWFLIMSMIYVISIMINSFISKEKMDI